MLGYKLLFAGGFLFHKFLPGTAILLTVLSCNAICSIAFWLCLVLIYLNMLLNYCFFTLFIISAPFFPSIFPLYFCIIMPIKALIERCWFLLANWIISFSNSDKGMALYFSRWISPDLAASERISIIDSLLILLLFNASRTALKWAGFNFSVFRLNLDFISFGVSINMAAITSGGIFLYLFT